MWAKFQAYPWWPAQLVQLARLAETGATFKRIADSWVDDTVLVAFYGKKREYSWMPHDRVKPFEGSIKQHLPTNKKHKHYRPILAAVKAAETALKMGPPRFSTSPLPAYISAYARTTGGENSREGAPIREDAEAEAERTGSSPATSSSGGSRSEPGQTREARGRGRGSSKQQLQMRSGAGVARDPPTSRTQGKGLGSAAGSRGNGGLGYSINDAPFAMLRDSGLSDEMAREIVRARNKRPFVSVGDCISRIRKLGRTKLLKLEAQNISIPRQPPGRKPSNPSKSNSLGQEKLVGREANSVSQSQRKGQKRKRTSE